MSDTLPPEESAQRLAEELVKGNIYQTRAGIKEEILEALLAHREAARQAVERELRSIGEPVAADTVRALNKHHKETDDAE